ncbi:MAG: DUF3108 domain-containing protein, partial [Candidatus Omnitrophica bacterium]|nr:DUF3108 domain-containing protein [Candidatus Omnitrophota bacterium]
MTAKKSKITRETNYELSFRRLLYLLFIAAFALIFSGCGMMVKYREVKSEIMAGKIENIVIRKPASEFRVGEKLTYGIYWHGIRVGFATTEVKDVVMINGREAYHLVGTVRSNSYLRFIFSVEDVMESFVDKETFLTLRHIVKRREGKYKAHWVMNYDWDNRKLNFKNLVDNTEKILSLTEKAEDQFSAFYYFRTLELYLVEP